MLASLSKMVALCLLAFGKFGSLLLQNSGLGGDWGGDRGGYLSAPSLQAFQVAFAEQWDARWIVHCVQHCGCWWVVLKTKVCTHHWYWISCHALFQLWVIRYVDVFWAIHFWPRPSTSWSSFLLSFGWAKWNARGVLTSRACISFTFWIKTTT